MPTTFTLEVAVPDRLLYKDEVDRLRAPAANGSLGVLPGHAPLVTELGTGVVSFEIGGKRRYLSVDGGVMEVQPERVRLLARNAEWAEEIDVKRSELALKRAMDLLQRHDMAVDVERAQKAVARARARLDAWREIDRPANR